MSKASTRHVDWERYVYLLYLAFLVFQPLFDERGFSTWGWTALLVAVFLPTYFWSYRQCGTRLVSGIVIMALLGFTGMYVNSGAGVFFVFAAAAAAGLGRPRRSFLAIGGIVALMLLSALTSPIDIPYRLFAYLPVLIITPLIGTLTLFQAERSRANAKLRLAQEEIEGLARVAERERIARDLHDLLGHTLSVITLKSELAGRLLSHDPEAAEREITDVERVSREALAEVRAAVSGYRSSGLLAELANAKLALESAGVSFAFQGDPSRLSPLQENTLSLVLREAVTNIVRHAGATRCFAQLSETESGITLDIRDDGVGLRAVNSGNGLNGIRERVQLLGGSLETVSLHGTRLIIAFPKGAKAGLAAPDLKAQAL